MKQKNCVSIFNGFWIWQRSKECKTLIIIKKRKKERKRESKEERKTERQKYTKKVIEK